jgi:hypothetical protein
VEYLDEIDKDIDSSAPKWRGNDASAYENIIDKIILLYSRIDNLKTDLKMTRHFYYLPIFPRKIY